MTDSRAAGVARESLQASDGQVLAAGLAREALISTDTPASFAGVVREALVSGVVVLGGQTSVTINTS